MESTPTFPRPDSFAFSCLSSSCSTSSRLASQRAEQETRGQSYDAAFRPMTGRAPATQLTPSTCMRSVTQMLPGCIRRRAIGYVEVKILSSTLADINHFKQSNRAKHIISQTLEGCRRGQGSKHSGVSQEVGEGNQSGACPKYIIIRDPTQALVFPLGPAGA